MCLNTKKRVVAVHHCRSYKNSKTPGFSGAITNNREQADWFSLARIARQLFIPIGPIQEMAEDILQKHNEWILRNFGQDALDLVIDLENKFLSINARAFPSLISAPKKYFVEKDIPEIIDKLRMGMITDLQLDDRLLPGDIRQHEAKEGKLNILNGGFGIALALHRTGELPSLVKGKTCLK